jgi:hypothetical protein
MPVQSHSMKRLFPILSLLLAFYLPACQKSGPEGLSETQAHLVKADPAGGGPAVDVFVLDKTGETVVPINRAAAWPQDSSDGSNTVALKLVDTGNRYGVSRWRMVYIVSIRSL